MIKIQCKLYNEPQESLSATQQILLNRGLSLDKQEEWLNVGSEYFDSFESYNSLDEFGEKTMDYMCAIYNEIIICLAEGKPIVIIVDPDVDGYTSAAILYNGIGRLFQRGVPKFMNAYPWMIPIFHEGKAHGFNDVMNKILEINPGLVIAPDGGSNDIEAHKALAEKGIRTAVLDHHEIDINPDESPAIIVNVQNSEHKNKALTGAGVTWAFIRYWEESRHYNHEVSDSLLDLCALGNIGDMADYRELEIRAIAKCGLANLQSPFLKFMAQKHDYSISNMNGLNYYSCAFYIAPYINAVVRSGTMEEKEFVFKALLDPYTEQMVKPSSSREKRAEIPWYEDAVLVTERVKRRQTNQQNEAMEFFDKQIEEEHLTKNAIILCHCDEGDIAPSLAGLIANKIQAKYQHPTMVLRDCGDELSGSARNYSHCDLEDMKSICSGTGLMNLAAGHSGAFGAAISKSNVSEFIEATNEAYSNIIWTPTYWIDYSWTADEVDADKVLEIGSMTIFGQEIPESLVAVNNVELKPHMLTLMGKNKDTIKVALPNGVNAIIFKQSEEVFNEMCEPNTYLYMVCKPNVNEWQGVISPQLLVEDFYLYEAFVF